MRGIAFTVFVLAYIILFVGAILLFVIDVTAGSDPYGAEKERFPPSPFPMDRSLNGG